MPEPPLPLQTQYTTYRLRAPVTTATPDGRLILSALASWRGGTVAHIWTMTDKTNHPIPSEAPKSSVASPKPVADKAVEPTIVEIGGPSGPEPTRYGDWERGGRCSDF